MKGFLHLSLLLFFLIFSLWIFIYKNLTILLIVEVTVVGQALDMGLHFILALYHLNEIVIIMDNGFISGQYCLRFIYMYKWQWDCSWWKYIPLHISLNLRCSFKFMSYFVTLKWHFVPSWESHVSFCYTFNYNIILSKNCFLYYNKGWRI